MSRASWPLHDAKNRLSTVIDAARKGEAQLVTRHNRPVAWYSQSRSMAALRRSMRGPCRALPSSSWPCHRTTSRFPVSSWIRGRSGSALYLLDTMVLSALRQRQRNENLVAWLQAVPESELFLSVITLGEVERGIAAVAPRDPAFAQRLVVWLDEVLRRFATRICRSRLPSPAAGAGWPPHGHGGADLLIAATALEHGLAVATSNSRHFLGTGVALVDPLAPKEA